jgi:DNA mismatch endonuclease (patch repair protein)
VTSGQKLSWATTDGTRRSMRTNKGRDPKPELAVRRLLHAAGLRYRVNYSVIPRRTADIVFTRPKAAV